MNKICVLLFPFQIKFYIWATPNMMRISGKVKHCSSKQPPKATNESLPILAGVAIAIIPKCPFCILAYSSAITLCSGTKMYMHAPDWTSWLSVGLAGLTLLMIVLNYRGKRTIMAALLVIAGSSLIISSELYTGEITMYYTGAVLLLFGVWLNANFYFIYNRWLKPVGQAIGRQLKPFWSITKKKTKV